MPLRTHTRSWQLDLKSRYRGDFRKKSSGKGEGDTYIFGWEGGGKRSLATVNTLAMISISPKKNIFYALFLYLQKKLKTFYEITTHSTVVDELHKYSNTTRK